MVLLVMECQILTVVTNKCSDIASDYSIFIGNLASDTSDAEILDTLHQVLLCLRYKSCY
jgi:hypothetical protein